MAAAGAGGGGDKLYVEDVFSTYVYEGTGASLAINNGIDLDEEGGFVWMKNRGTAGRYHALYDTERGVQNELNPNDSREQQVGENQGLTAFNSNGFTVGNRSFVNTDDDDYVSWTFRKAPGFLDIVTWTGNSVTGREIPHNLGSVPGMIIIKRSDAARSWIVYHRSMGNGHIMKLDNTLAKESSALFNSTDPTDEVFEVNNDHDVNYTGGSYVAYLFAHNEESFGAAGDESIISCGTYSGSGGGTNPFIDLGWEPQWVLIKCRTNSEHWFVFDNMRGMPHDQKDQWLRASSTDVEGQSSYTVVEPLPTGFEVYGGGLNEWNGNHTYDYMAIRRPMKVPTAGTEVFAADTRTSGEGEGKYVSNFVVDWALANNYDSVGNTFAATRLTESHLQTNSNTTEGVHTGDGYGDGDYTWEHMDGLGIGENGAVFGGSTNNIALMFRRAPEFFDIVCYTGNDASDRGVTHGLGVTPEMYIVKSRTRSQDWKAWHKGLPGYDYTVRLDTAGGHVQGANGIFGGNAPTSTLFYVDDTGNTMVTNQNNDKYVCYLFATLAGVSKVGSYTADATVQTINCGFSGGARFILIKKLGSGSWFMWNSTRGIVAGNDPYLILEDTPAEVTNTDWIDPDNSGFQITAEAGSVSGGINIDTEDYIFLAIA